ncbi:MAG: hypothetical protein HND48_12010 [Chloroflexi bacterium]|nr:hypothetical protein [Chloroflexota bacterium]
MNPRAPIGDPRQQHLVHRAEVAVRMIGRHAPFIAKEYIDRRPIQRVGLLGDQCVCAEWCRPAGQNPRQRPALAPRAGGRVEECFRGSNRNVAAFRQDIDTHTAS